MGRVGNGVEIRAKSIRVQFTYNGKICRERVTLNGVALPPTTANHKYAIRMVAEIRQRIATGTFNYGEYFPDSKNAEAGATGESTFGDLCDLWLRSKGKLQAATQNQYETAVRFWKKMFGENTPLKDIDHKVVAAKIGEYPWPSPKTHNNYMIALRGIFHLEYRGEKAAKNPTLDIANLKLIKKKPDPLTIKERDKILADMRQHYDERVYAYFLWMFYTGMRPEEAIALRWSDVDFERETVRVQRVRTFKGSERDGSKTNVVRDVDLVPQALAALKIMERHTKNKAQEDGAPMDIFQNPGTGKPWHDERSQRVTYWRPSLTRLGIRWRTPYSCRHTAASVALMAGVPAPYIAKQLGHSIKILLEVYADWIPDNDQGRAKSLLKAAMLVVSNEVDEKNPLSSERIYPTSIPPNLRIAASA